METTSFNESWSSDNDDYKENLSAGKVIQMVAGLLTLIGMAGNVMTCLIVFGKRNLPKPLNIFLGTLAISDLLCCLICLAVFTTQLLFKRWILGNFLCCAIMFAFEFYEYYSVIIISTAICLFSCHKVTLKLAYVTIFIVVICSTIISLPKAKLTKLYTDGEQEFCTEDWTNNTFKMIHEVLQLFVNMAIPFVMLIVSLCLRFVVRIDADPSSSRLLVVVMVVYVLLCAPFLVLHCFNPHDWFTIHILLHQLAMLTVVYKPIVYYNMDDTFKKEFLYLIPRCFKINRPDEYMYNVQLT